MAYNHYTDIRVKGKALASADPGDPTGSNVTGDEAMLLGRAVGAVHRTNSRLAETLRLAISFPGLDVEGRGPGARLRIFGTTAELERFREDHGAFICAGGVMEMSTVREVPEDCVSFVAYVRARESEKLTDSAILRGQDRLERRMTERGESRTEIAEALIRFLRHRLGERQGRRGTPAFLRMMSGSTGQIFSILIERIDLSGAHQGEVNIYGLSKASQPHGLPVF